jgi:hypothetical protein
MVLVALAAGGSFGCIDGILNPSFVNRSSGGVFPVAPGDTDFIAVMVANQTNRDIVFRLTAEAADGVQQIELNTTPNLPRQGTTFLCPVSRIGLGTLGDLASGGYIISPPGIPNQFFEAPFARNPLTEGRSFICGDTVIFFAFQDVNVAGGVSISVGRIAGATQTGPFTGADTFENLEDIIFVDPE